MLGAPVAGNVGRALLELDGEVDPGRWIVCEVSSFQLEDVHEFRPRVAVLLNLEPDHLDRHGSLDAYRAAKLRLFENQGPDDVAVVPRGFDAVPGHGRRVDFTAADALPAEPSLPGAHNRENAAAATAAARAAGADDAEIADALRSFAGVAHRLELVGERRGVRWVNDSKATNIAATRRALASYDAPLHVILGGQAKGEDFRTLELPPNVRSVLLVGEAAEEIRAALGRGDVVHDLAAAVARAADVAAPGDVVLLSPACASYDQFRNFEDRGDTYRDLVRGLGV
jgi:UDP-N-acetylmuramoylalanine--D-glutamate ligase